MYDGEEDMSELADEKEGEFRGKMANDGPIDKEKGCNVNVCKEEEFGKGLRGWSNSANLHHKRSKNSSDEFSSIEEYILPGFSSRDDKNIGKIGKKRSFDSEAEKAKYVGFGGSTCDKGLGLLNSTNAFKRLNYGRFPKSGIQVKDDFFRINKFGLFGSDNDIGSESKGLSRVKFDESQDSDILIPDNSQENELAEHEELTILCSSRGREDLVLEDLVELEAEYVPKIHAKMSSVNEKMESDKSDDKGELDFIEDDSDDEWRYGIGVDVEDDIEEDPQIFMDKPVMSDFVGEQRIIMGSLKLDAVNDGGFKSLDIDLLPFEYRNSYEESKGEWDEIFEGLKVKYEGGCDLVESIVDLMASSTKYIQGQLLLQVLLFSENFHGHRMAMCKVVGDSGSSNFCYIVVLFDDLFVGRLLGVFDYVTYRICGFEWPFHHLKDMEIMWEDISLICYRDCKSINSFYLESMHPELDFGIPEFFSKLKATSGDNMSAEAARIGYVRGDLSTMEQINSPKSESKGLLTLPIEKAFQAKDHSCTEFTGNHEYYNSFYNALSEDSSHGVFELSKSVVIESEKEFPLNEDNLSPHCRSASFKKMTNVYITRVSSWGFNGMSNSFKAKVLQIWDCSRSKFKSLMENTFDAMKSTDRIRSHADLVCMIDNACSEKILRLYNSGSHESTPASRLKYVLARHCDSDCFLWIKVEGCSSVLVEVMEILENGRVFEFCDFVVDRFFASSIRGLNSLVCGSTDGERLFGEFRNDGTVTPSSRVSAKELNGCHGSSTPEKLNFIGLLTKSSSSIRVLEDECEKVAKVIRDPEVGGDCGDVREWRVDLAGRILGRLNVTRTGFSLPFKSRYVYAIEMGGECAFVESIQKLPDEFCRMRIEGALRKGISRWFTMDEYSKYEISGLEEADVSELSSNAISWSSSLQAKVYYAKGRCSAGRRVSAREEVPCGGDFQRYYYYCPSCLAGNGGSRVYCMENGEERRAICVECQKWYWVNEVIEGSLVEWKVESDDGEVTWCLANWKMVPMREDAMYETKTTLILDPEEMTELYPEVTWNGARACVCEQ